MTDPPVLSYDLLPLGVFGVHPLDRLVREDLEPLIGQLDQHLSASIAEYLRSGQSILAFMMYTRDVINDSFGVSGGPAIWTDGVYFYRHEAADYIETYGIGIPPEAIELMRLSNWRAPTIEQADIGPYYVWLQENARNY